LPEEFWRFLFALAAMGIILMFIRAVKKNLKGEACSCGCGGKQCEGCKGCQEVHVSEKKEY